MSPPNIAANTTRSTPIMPIDQPSAITRFAGQHRFLSNFYPAPLIWEHLRYPTVEHAYQAAKTLDATERLRVRNAQASPAMQSASARHSPCAATGQKYAST
jgi:predicted NAD-dependent protein-ADP-ribosyltransferase YbiA (DUF1768 family)